MSTIEKQILENLNGLFDIIDFDKIIELKDLFEKIESVELVEEGVKNEIESHVKNSVVFAKIVLKENVPHTDVNHCYLAFHKKGNESKYSQLTVIVRLTHLGPLQFMRYITIKTIDLGVQFDLPKNISVLKPNEEQMKKFEEKFPTNIIGRTSHLLAIVQINQFNYFLGYSIVTCHPSIVLPIFEPVEGVHIHPFEVKMGGWSDWSVLNEEMKDLFEKAIPVYGAMTITPISYRSQIVNGTNYQVLAHQSYRGIGVSHHLVKYSFHVSLTGEVSDIKCKVLQ